MELRRAADALLRSQASPLTAFLAPSVASRWQAGKQLICNSSSNRLIYRNFVTTNCCHALKPQPTTSATPISPPKVEDDIDDIAKSLNWIDKGSSRSWTNRFPSPSAQASSRLSSHANHSQTERELLLNGGNTSSDLLNEFNARRPKSPSSDFDFNRMIDPIVPRRPRNDAHDMMQNLNISMAPPKPAKIPMRLTPSTGRTVTIGNGIDVGRGFRLLEQSCARNKVRADFTKQRFHERGGLKRKRLVRERWRRRFAVGFKAAIGRVKQLKNQGW